MHPIIEKFTERPKNQQIIACSIVVLIILGLCWQYLLKGVINERNDLETSIEDLQVKILEQRRIARDLPRFKEEVQKLDKKLELVLYELPDNKEIPDLLSAISALAVDTGLEVIKFSPKPELLQEFYAMVPVDIELEGSYHQLLTFFDEVGHLSRIVNIDSIAVDIVTESKSEVLIRATCRAVTFRYLSEEEQKKLAAPKAGKTSRKRRTVK